MVDDEEVLRMVQNAFSGYARPEHFTNYMHCEECAEHDQLLLSRNLDTLRLEDVGNPGWDPLCYVSPVGFGYYLPALARLALSAPSPTHGWYGPQLLFHLTYQAEANRYLLAFDLAQRRAVLALLQHLATTRPELVREWMCAKDLKHAIGLWSGSKTDA